jgi:O-antigen/teichoic acid export membrane protein
MSAIFICYCLFIIGAYLYQIKKEKFNFKGSSTIMLMLVILLGFILDIPSIVKFICVGVVCLTYLFGTLKFRAS